MPNEVIINASAGETRVALMERGTFHELHLERESGRSVGGMVVLGKVTRVLPGMQAAFVDIGLEKAAFLYVGDYFDDSSNGNADSDDDEDSPRPRRAGAARSGSRCRRSRSCSRKGRRSWSRSPRSRSAPRARASPLTSRSRAATSCLLRGRAALACRAGSTATANGADCAKSSRR